jgi:amino-acid N-acetyltransferase
MIRKANINDPEKIAKLVNHYASRELMLPRALNDIYENLRDFFICEKQGDRVGCVALHITWKGLGEIRSLAVEEDYCNQGIGTDLVNACIEEAHEMNMGRIFVLTYEPEFFSRFGFQLYSKDKLPHKVWTDCLKCPKFPNCDEIAMILELE